METERSLRSRACRPVRSGNSATPPCRLRSHPLASTPLRAAPLPPLLPTLLALLGSNVRSCGQAEPVAQVPEVRHVPAAVGRPAEPAADVAPATAAQHASRGRDVVHRVRLSSPVCVIKTHRVPVGAPLPHVPVQLVKPPAIRSQTVHRDRAFSIPPCRCPFWPRRITIEIADICRAGLPIVLFAEREGRLAPRAAGIFPLGFRRQLTATPDRETPRIVPRHIHHRAAIIRLRCCFGLFLPRFRYQWVLLPTPTMADMAPLKQLILLIRHAAFVQTVVGQRHELLRIVLSATHTVPCRILVRRRTHREGARIVPLAAADQGDESGQHPLGNALPLVALLPLANLLELRQEASLGRRPRHALPTAINELGRTDWAFLVV